MVGLTAEEALKRLEQYGPNILPKAKPTAMAILFLRQFKNPLIYILLVASAISLWLGEIGDA
ncbi:MAG: hypothetical protein KDD76_03510, partial [Rickettsiales bacterium]|nr:hypothetical protein [Rickettsiales bacterium]